MRACEKEDVIIGQLVERGGMNELLSVWVWEVVLAIFWLFTFCAHLVWLVMKMVGHDIWNKIIQMLRMYISWNHGIPQQENSPPKINVNTFSCHRFVLQTAESAIGLWHWLLRLSTKCFAWLWCEIGSGCLNQIVEQEPSAFVTVQEVSRSCNWLRALWQDTIVVKYFSSFWQSIKHFVQFTICSSVLQ